MMRFRGACLERSTVSYVRNRPVPLTCGAHTVADDRTSAGASGVSRLTVPAARSRTYTSARSLTSSGTSRTYDVNATNRPSSLTDTAAGSDGRVWLSPRATVTKLRRANIVSVPASTRTTSASARRRGRRAASTAGAGTRDLVGDTLTGGNRALRFEVTESGIGAHARPRSRGHGREIHFVELLENVFELVRDERDSVPERADLYFGVQTSACAARDPRQRRIPGRALQDGPFDDDVQPGRASDPAALTPECGRVAQHRGHGRPKDLGNCDVRRERRRTIGRGRFLFQVRTCGVQREELLSRLRQTTHTEHRG